MHHFVTALAAIAAAQLLTGCARCDVDAAARARAGPGAVDCGHVVLGTSSREADACAVAAFRANRPFLLQQDLPGIDSFVTEYYVRDASGAMFHLVYDSDVNGGRTGRESAYEEACAAPAIVVRDGFEQVTCRPGAPTRSICRP